MNLILESILFDTVGKLYDVRLEAEIRINHFLDRRPKENCQATCVARFPYGYGLALD